MKATSTITIESSDNVIFIIYIHYIWIVPLPPLDWLRHSHLKIFLPGRSYESHAVSSSSRGHSRSRSSSRGRRSRSRSPSPAKSRSRSRSRSSRGSYESSIEAHAIEHLDPPSKKDPPIYENQRWSGGRYVSKYSAPIYSDSEESITSLEAKKASEEYKRRKEHIAKHGDGKFKGKHPDKLNKKHYKNKKGSNRGIPRYVIEFDRNAVQRDDYDGTPQGFGSWYGRRKYDYSRDELDASQGHQDRVRTVDLHRQDIKFRSDDDSHLESDWVKRTGRDDKGLTHTRENFLRDLKYVRGN